MQLLEWGPIAISIIAVVLAASALYWQRRAVKLSQGTAAHWQQSAENWKAVAAHWQDAAERAIAANRALGEEVQRLHGSSQPLTEAAPAVNPAQAHFDLDT